MAILQAVVQRFNRKMCTLEPEVEKPDGLTALIDRLGPIFTLMERRILIDVLCERSGARYQSMVLGVDLEKQCLELDELFPGPGNLMQQPGDRFEVQYHQGGDVLCFGVELIDIIGDASAPVYRVSLPHQLLVRQRRRNPRVELNRQQPLTVKLLSPQNRCWFATAINLSADGMRIVIGGNIAGQLHKNAVLPVCEFQFRGEPVVHCEARVTAFRFSRHPSRHTGVSIEFLGLTRQQRHFLAQLVNCCQPSSRAA